MTLLTSAPTAFTSLERPYYTEPEVYDLELTEIFEKQWIVFGHISDIPNPGDSRVQQIAHKRVLVSRGAAGDLQAFDDTDASDGDLPSVHMEIFHGFIYVALGAEAPEESVASGFGKADEVIDEHELENLKLAHRIVYEVDCNWKLLLENFLECYHCEGSHPELCAVMTWSDYLGDVEDTIVHEGFQFGAVPVPEGLVSQSMDGSQVAPLLGRVTLDNIPMSVGLIITPALSAIQIFADYVLVLREVPLDAHRTHLIGDWYVRGDAVEGKDYDVQTLIALWDVTNREDIELSERNQRGVNSRVYVPGPNSLRMERAIHEALELYRKRLGSIEHLSV